jgi:hypothetical protein
VAVLATSSIFGRMFSCRPRALGLAWLVQSLDPLKTEVAYVGRCHRK